MSDYETVRSWAQIGFGFSQGIEPAGEPELSEYRAKQATIDKVLVTMFVRFPPKGRVISEEAFRYFRELFEYLLDEIADDPATQMDSFGSVSEGPQKWLQGVIEQGRALDIDCWEYWKNERSEYEVNFLMEVYRGEWE